MDEGKIKTIHPEQQHVKPDSAHPPLTSHPRRPPAHKSLSLKHSRENTPQIEDEPSTAKTRKARGRTPVSNRANLGPSLSSIPIVPDKTASSGESSNADKWFEKSNNNVRTGSADIMDNDPPFFLRNSSSSETSPDMLERERANQQALESLPHRTGLMHLGTAASSSEDFRSVIDDLTVQNKKLKRKLKKYEKLHDAHLNADKLFEIRVHGLAPHKKRELEETLRKFAAGLDSAPTTSPSGRGSEHQHASVPPSMEQQLTASSSLGNVDSAYASASGHNSSMQSGQGGNFALKRETTAQPGMSTAQQRDIHTYLSDIPQGLLPRPVAMTEKSKKKLIVRRLEQIFAGKGASKGGHQQPIQQQEISQSAARADRSEREAKGRQWSKEGAREARIMNSGKRRSIPTETKMDVELPPPKPPAPRIANTDFATSTVKGGKSPDQRPTRPLDLDPERAQVPEDNIKYLQHLGFSPLEAGSDDQLVDGHGYMYLNVLINMAQLHTLNVTPEFVKKALEQFSKKLELSNDGRKVRWKGGSELTRTSSNGSPDDNSNTSGQPSSRVDGRKKSLLASASGDGSSTSLSKSDKTSKEENKLAYIPLFFHQEEDDESDSDDISDWSSPPDEQAAANSSGLTSSGMLTTSSKKQANDGPIIFYNKAPFVTDLSGDWRGANVKTVNIQDYSSFPVHAVGIARPSHQLERMESRGPLSKQDVAVADPDSMDMDGVVSGDSMHGFSKPPSMKTAGSSSDDSPDPIELEASGVGGVHPSDNFALNVKTRQRLIREISSDTRTKNYPPHIRLILAESAATSSAAAQSRATGVEILTNRRKDLPPSELPPPSYFPMSSPEDEDEYTDSGEEDELFDTPLNNDRPLLSAAPRAFKLPAHGVSNNGASEDGDESTDDDDDNDDDDDDDSDGSGSPDMLAHARMINPELIRQAEREYDAGIAERLAKDIPAGSSAATAGGGSGFNSPITTTDDMDVDGVGTGSRHARHASMGKSPEEKIPQQQQQRGILKRSRPKEGANSHTRKSPKLDKRAGVGAN